jgi:hypothetical protein
MESVVNAINLLSRRLNSFRLVEVQEKKMTFQVGPHVHAFFGVSEGVLEAVGDDYKVTPHSTWVEGIIRGKTRNDAGELV